MNSFDETKILLIGKNKFKTFISEINPNKKISYLNCQFRLENSVVNFYTKIPITNFDILIGGAFINTNYCQCIPIENGWFKIQIFLNDPIIPFNKLLYHEFSFMKVLNKNETGYEWPDIYYIPGIDNIKTSNNIADREDLIVQNTDGLYNCIRFQSGLAGINYNKSFRILPYDCIIEYLKGKIKLYKSVSNSDKADSMNIAKEMFKEYKNFLKTELELVKTN